jgi:hypothetical protein
LFPDLSRYAVIVLLIVSVVPEPLQADELKLVPGLELKEEFNDNIFLATTSRRMDYITTLTPSLDLSSATERGSVSLTSGVNWLKYARNGGLDSLDYYIQSGLGYRIAPRLSVSAGAGYVQNSRPDRIDQSGLTLTSGSDRLSFQTSGNYAVSEKSTAMLSYAFSREVFTNTGSLDTTVHTVNLSQDYDLGRYLEQTKLVGSFGYSRNLTDISLVDNYTLSLGLTRKFHELWSVSLNAGGRFTHSEFDVTTFIPPAQFVPSTRQDDDMGWIGNLSVNYSGIKTNASLTFNHDVTTASGRTGATERTGGSANFSSRFTGELSGFLGMGYSWNRSGQNRLSAQTIDEQNVTFSSGVRYDFSEYVSLEGNYRYNMIYYGNTSAEARQNVFLLRLMLRRDVMDH